MKLVAISDTHNNHRKVEVPKCDILIHAGDWTSMGRKHEVEAFAKWLDLQEQAEHIVVVPGNHELDFETHVICHGGVPSSWNCKSSPTHTS